MREIIGVFFLGTVLLSGAILWPSTVKSDVPSRVGDASPLVFTVNNIYPKEGRIVLNDQTYWLTSGTRVYRLDGSIGALSDLQPGTRITIQATTADPTKRILNAARILPQNR